VDRRQVDDVEAHRGDGVEALGGGAEVAARDRAGRVVAGGALGAGEELVPAAGEGALAVGVRRVGPLDRHQLTQRVGQQQGVELGVLQRGEPGGNGPAVDLVRGLDGAGQQLVPVPVGGVEVGGDALEQQPRLGEHQLDVDAGGDLDAAVVLPGRDRVGP